MNRVTLAGSVLACATALTALFPATAGAAAADGAGTHPTTLCTGKQAWPELEGADVHEAVATIERENPAVTTVVLPRDSVVTMDFRCDRVRVFHEGDTPAPLTVSRPPQVG